MQKRKFFWAIAIFIMIVAVAFFYYKYDPISYRFFPKCIFKTLTGYDCPGCGTQRALHAFLHGEFLKAIKYNLFFVILLVFFPLYFYSKYFNKKLFYYVSHRYVMTFFIVFYFVYGVVRNL